MRDSMQTPMAEPTGSKCGVCACHTTTSFLSDDHPNEGKTVEGNNNNKKKKTLAQTCMMISVDNI